MSRLARFAAPAAASALCHGVVWCAGGRDVVAQRQLEAGEILEDRGDTTAPGFQRQVAEIDAVDLDRARLRVVQPAEQLGERRLAGAVLPDDRERRAGGNREIEALEDRRSLSRAQSRAAGDTQR